ncbi:MAG: NAD-dependent epimerase/dehydratase family protein [Elusimicrobia bacterium]|nr:NAD-dependent epimerase/dehydratase family protein [Elusimicrobiota bacterium]MBD3412266.1 NAD-dependent epimerase/dehydratase family protein [Elusimicrobiota bacterium]
MRYAVIGSEGFIGSSVCRILSSRRSTTFFKIDRIMPKKDGACAGRYRIDIRDTGAVASLCKKRNIDVVLNLSGIFNAPHTEDLFEMNSFAPVRLLEALQGYRSTVVLVGSAAEYGIHKQKNRISEQTSLNPVSDYGVSKACQTFMALRFAGRFKLPKIIIARPFNVVGPGMPEHLFLGSFARQLSRIEKGLQEPVITAGNLTSFRDIIPVDQLALALVEIPWKGRHGHVYNVCSGIPVKIRSVLEDLIKRSTKKITINISQKRFKKYDIPWSVGSNSKINKILRIRTTKKDLSNAVTETLEYYRTRKP